MMRVSWRDNQVYDKVTEYAIDARLLVIKIELIVRVLGNGEYEKIRTLAMVDSQAQLSGQIQSKILERIWLDRYITYSPHEILLIFPTT